MFFNLHECNGIHARGPENPQQKSSKASEKQPQTAIDKSEPASGESTKGEEGSQDKTDPQPQAQETATIDTKEVEPKDKSDFQSQASQAAPSDSSHQGNTTVEETARGTATAETNTQSSQLAMLDHLKERESQGQAMNRHSRN